VIFYPLIRDRVLRTIDYDCKFLPDKNPEFVIAMAFGRCHSVYSQCLRTQIFRKSYPDIVIDHPKQLVILLTLKKLQY